jgi:hypothetical protein
MAMCAEDVTAPVGEISVAAAEVSTANTNDGGVVWVPGRFE